MNTWIGQKLKISIFGESHGKAVGCVADGLDSGLEIDCDYINSELEKRRPASLEYTTQRRETDEFEIISGVTQGKTNGSPLCVIFKNKDSRSDDYNTIVPRPSHADFAAYVKYSGNCDIKGGGHFSARLTAPLVFIGSICKRELEKRGIYCAAAITSIGKTHAKGFYDVAVTHDLLKQLNSNMPIADERDRAALFAELEAARRDKDSVGGSVECCFINLPIGLGEPFFDSVESSLARLMFSIPAVKGIEFGRGFSLSEMRGSQANDQFNADAIKSNFKNMNNEREIAYNNNAGGIIGGLTNSMPLIFKVAFKPIPSIGQEMRSVDMHSLEPVIVRTEGRHDVCAAVRGASVIVSTACICIYDFLQGKTK